MTKQEFLSKIGAYLTDMPSKDTFFYWYPLQSIREDVPAVAFDLWKLYDHDKGIAQLECVLCRASIQTASVFQNQNYSPAVKEVNLPALLYEADADGYNFPWYVESYYYDDSKNWMIYTSHEFTITFTGKELAEIATQIIDHKYALDIGHPPQTPNIQD